MVFWVLTLVYKAALGDALQMSGRLNSFVARFSIRTFRDTCYQLWQADNDVLLWIELTLLKNPPREAVPSLGQSLGLTPRKKLSLSRSICSRMLSNGSTPSRSRAAECLGNGSGSPFWLAILPESVTASTFGECSRSHCSKWCPVRLASWGEPPSHWSGLTHVSGEESGDVTHF